MVGSLLYPFAVGMATGCMFGMLVLDCLGLCLKSASNIGTIQVNLSAGMSLPMNFKLPSMLLLPFLCPRQAREQRAVNKPSFLFPPALLFSSSPSAFIFHSVLSFRKPDILYTEKSESLSHSLIYCPFGHHAAPSAVPSVICSFPAASAVLHLSSRRSAGTSDPCRRATIMAANLQLEPRHVHGATARFSQLHSPGG